MSKRGRPPVNGNSRKSLYIKFRVSGSEWAKIFECADEDGKTISQEIRDLVDKRLEEQAEMREDRRKQREAWYSEQRGCTDLENPWPDYEPDSDDDDE